jgi:hypothetical protein
MGSIGAAILLVWVVFASNPFTRPLAPNGQGSTNIFSLISYIGGPPPATAASSCILVIAVHSDVMQYTPFKERDYSFFILLSVLVCFGSSYSCHR